MIITRKTTQLGSYIQQDGMFFYQTSSSSSQQMFMDFCLKEDGCYTVVNMSLSQLFEWCYCHQIENVLMSLTCFTFPR